MKELTIDNKTINVYPSSVPNTPVVYFNTFEDEGEKVLHILREQSCPDFTLVTICGLDWNNELSPWKSPAVFHGDNDFNGEADRFLKVLTEKVIPQVEAGIADNITWRGIAGYSLAGLFAVYALYRTNLFSRVASMSGSLWFPDFKEYALAHELKCLPECVYFSIGDKESKTRNTYLKTVQNDTIEIAEFLKTQGIDTMFELSPGNHYKDADIRSAAGIRWILEQ